MACRAEGEKVAIRVTDTGDGISRDSAAYLFDEFFQVDNHERDWSKGFGLGLAICRALARQLGGDVRLVRTGNDGSCFEVTIRDERSGRGGRIDFHQGEGRDPVPTGLSDDPGMDRLFALLQPEGSSTSDGIALPETK